ncbi:MAG: LD-carboxypeptidase [Planctomycetota bacterium]|jgi:muramoyltetrapeptide carboxypeptidase
MRRIHLIAPAGPCQTFLDHELIGSFERMMALVADAVSEFDLDVTADEALFASGENDGVGGRTDDAARAHDITSALGDEATAAVIAIRGGAWLSRVLPRIDFDVLNRRSNPVATFGFSEITSLVNIVASYDKGRGVYDDSPAFLVYGLRHYAQTRATVAELGGMVPRAWMNDRLVSSFQGHFRDVCSMIHGRGTRRDMTARLVQGELGEDARAEFVGGNLTVFPALLASTYDERIDVRGRWIVLEDYNDRVSRLDRMLSHLTLAGAWDSCAGVMLGDFHVELDQLTDSVLACLRYHLPQGWDKPILVTDCVGHVYPMSPLPLHVPVAFASLGDGAYRLSWDPACLCTVYPQMDADGRR